MVQAVSSYKLEEAAVTPRARPRSNWGAWLGARSLGWLLPVALLGLWTLITEKGWAPPQLLPAPRLVLDTIIDLAKSGELLTNYAISLGRVTAGFFVGAVLG